MKHFTQAENYVSLDTLEFISKEHKDLVILVSITDKEYRLKLYTKNESFFLGSTRRLIRIPSKSKYPNLWHYLAFGNNTIWCRLLHIETIYSKK